MPVNRQSVLCRYHYDPLDCLVSCAPATEATLQRFYCKSRLVTEIQGQIQRTIFQQGDQLLAQQQREGGKIESSLLVTDLPRSVLHVLSANERQQMVYTAYGYRHAESGLSSLLGFNGEGRDPVTGHYLLGNGYRAFNPVLMRFNSPDSWSPFGNGGVNPYAYCLGNPVKFNDPTGHIPHLFGPSALAIIGGVGATAGFITGTIGGIGMVVAGAVADEKMAQTMTITALVGTAMLGLSLLYLRFSGKASLVGSGPRPIHTADTFIESYAKTHGPKATAQMGSWRAPAVRNSPIFSSPSNTSSPVSLRQASASAIPNDMFDLSNVDFPYKSLHDSDPLRTRLMQTVIPSNPGIEAYRGNVSPYNQGVADGFKKHTEIFSEVAKNIRTPRR